MFLTVFLTNLPNKLQKKLLKKMEKNLEYGSFKQDQLDDSKLIIF